jgi:hypothetical protein
MILNRSHSIVLLATIAVSPSQPRGGYLNFLSRAYYNFGLTVGRQPLTHVMEEVRFDDEFVLR